MNWTIIEYELGRHTAIPTSIGRLGIAYLIPLIEEYVKKAQRKISRPALPRLIFVPADEFQVRTIMERVQYAEKAWRDHNGQLICIPDSEMQRFLDGLDKRDKKAKALKKPMNLSEAAERDWFALYSALYGRQAAIKRFGHKIAREVA